MLRHLRMRRLVHHVRATIHLLHQQIQHPRQARFLAHHVLEIIHSHQQLVGQCLVRQQTDLFAQASAHLCRVIVPEQFVPVSQRVQRVQRELPAQELVLVHHVQVAPAQVLLIVHHLQHLQQVHHLPSVERVAVAINAAVPQEHSVSKEVRRVRRTRARRLFVKSSTIWLHHLSVERSFRMVMARQ